MPDIDVLRQIVKETVTYNITETRARLPQRDLSSESFFALFASPSPQPSATPFSGGDEHGGIKVWPKAMLRATEDEDADICLAVADKQGRRR
jgi:hypothetical protein